MALYNQMTESFRCNGLTDLVVYFNCLTFINCIQNLVSDDRVIIHDELEGSILLRHCPNIYLDRVRKITKYL